MATAYSPSPTPSRAFAAIKTPPPVERQAGAPVGVQDRLDRLVSRMLAAEAAQGQINDLTDACLAELEALEGEQGA